jgi:signal peptidase II
MGKISAVGGLRWAWVALAVIVLDQGAKHALSAVLEPFRPVAIVPSLNLVLTYNTGVSFSLLALPSGAQRWPLVAVAVAIGVLLLYWLRRLPPDRVLLPVGIALVLGGAMGNMIDRIVLGRVIDFVQFYYGSWSFAVFNLADAAISVGVVLMLADGLFGVGQERAAGKRLD